MKDKILDIIGMLLLTIYIILCVIRYSIKKLFKKK